MDFFKLIIKFWILNVKQLVSTRTNLILFIVFPIIALFVPIIFIPMSVSIGIVFILSLVPINGAIYATSNYSINQSTLRSNLNLRHNSRYSLYLSTILTMLSVTIIAATVIFILLCFANSMSILKSGWAQYDNALIVLDAPLFATALYVSIEISLITFALSFALQRFFANINTYFIMIFSLMILAVIFGATFNQYSSADSGTLVLDPNTAHSTLPASLFIPSLIFPYYAPAQVLAIQPNIYIFWDSLLTEEGTYNALDAIFSYQSLSWSWLVALPWVEMGALVLIGAFLSKVYKK